MNSELKEAFEELEKEKGISGDLLFGAIEEALVQACKTNYSRAVNIKTSVDRDTFEYKCSIEKTVVELESDVMDPQLEISYDEAKQIDPNVQIGDQIDVNVDSQSLGRIATMKAKQLILQKIHEAERNMITEHFLKLKDNIVTGIVQRYIGRSISVNLGLTDGTLNEKEQVPGEHLKPTDRIKVYILNVSTANKRGPRILVSRTHPGLVRRLFEQEVTEIRDGIVEIKGIVREAGSRTKIAVWSNDPNVDPVGACVGQNGSRVNNIVDELRGEKIDIISWNENPGNFIQNALSPAKIVAVFADPEEKTAKVVVPDYQLSLAIGREGQNARLAAKLTGYKIDIKSETQAKDAPGFRYEDYMDDEYDEYDEDYEFDEASEEAAGEGLDEELSGEELPEAEVSDEEVLNEETSGEGVPGEDTLTLNEEATYEETTAEETAGEAAGEDTALNGNESTEQPEAAEETADPES